MGVCGTWSTPSWFCFPITMDARELTAASGMGVAGRGVAGEQFGGVVARAMGVALGGV